MQAAPRGGDTMFGVKSGWTPNGNQIHGTVGEEFRVVRIARGAGFGGELTNLFGVASEHRSDLNAVNRAGSARMRLRNISATNQANVNRHVATKPWVFLKPEDHRLLQVLFREALDI
jgi:hypothetical protein